MDTVIKLISTNPVQRPDGTWTGTPEGREVFAKVQSATRYEFLEAARAGLNPSYRFDIFAGEYHGENIVEYNGQTYSVYRTYQSDANAYVSAQLRERQELTADYIQLYVQREGGTIGVGDNGH